MLVGLFAPAHLECVLGACTSIQTVCEHKRECDLTQLSTSRVFTGGEYQGEYLDKTIDDDCHSSEGVREQDGLRLHILEFW